MRTNMNQLRLFVTVLVMVIIIPLSTYAANGTEEITISGTIKKQGITAYQYGTHVLVDDGSRKSYALKSSHVDLDKYVERRVTLKGVLVPGYPVDSGPDFLEVKTVVGF
jgi:hypothetical protein